MEIKKLLQIGVGKTGNIILNEMMNLDGRYVGLFINTAKKDMISLENFDETNYYKIPQVDGTGRDREKAKNYLVKWKDSFVDLMLSYDDFDTIVFYFSTDGGTGSGCSPTLINMVKGLYMNNFNKEINIIAVAVMPNNDVSINGLRNSLECWNDLLTLKKNGIINTLYLVDNNKRETYEEINKEVANSLNIAFTFDSFDPIGTIDTSDSFNLNLANGYNLILKLSNRYKNVEDAILEAQEKSVFVLPSDGNYASNYLGVLLEKDNYSSDDVLTIVSKGRIETYCGVSEDESVILFGGLQIPNGAIDVIEETIKNSDGKIIENNIDSLFVKIEEKDIVEGKNEEKVVSQPMQKSSRNIRKMANDDLFKF